MKNNIKRLKQLQQEIEWLTITAPLAQEEIDKIEATLKTKIHPELKTILLNLGYTFIGIDLYTNIIKNTLHYRQTFSQTPQAEIISHGICISGDGCGNPIVLSEDGQLYLLYHDDEGFEELQQTLSILLASHIAYLESLIAKNKTES